MMDAKTTGIIAYLTWIGLLVAFLAGDKEGAKFHLNQTIVLLLAGVICSFVVAVPFIGWLVGGVGWIFLIICWFIGFIGACKGEENPVPLLGSIQLLK